MKKILVPAVCSLLLLLLTIPSACYYDNEEDLYGPVATCDTTDVRFSVEIQAILQSRCVSCHGPTVYVDLGGGYSLNTHAEVSDQALSGQLVTSISRSSGWMPKGESKLPDCSIAQIQAWVNRGAPDN